MSGYVYVCYVYVCYGYLFWLCFCDFSICFWNCEGFFFIFFIWSYKTYNASINDIYVHCPCIQSIVTERPIKSLSYVKIKLQNEQVLLTFQSVWVHPRVFNGVRFAKSSVFYVLFCQLLFVLFPFFLSFFCAIVLFAFLRF